jgi:sugar phosphate isomerase/epimerase
VTTFCLPTYNHMPELGAVPDVGKDIVAAGAAGFELVGLDFGGVKHFTRGSRTLGDLRSLLDDHGVACYEMAALYVGDDRDQAVAALDGVIGIVESLRPRHVIVGVDLAGDAAAPVLRRICRELAGVDVKVAVEFVAGLRVDSIAAARGLLRAVEDPTAGILLDSWHFFRGPSTWRDLEALPLEQLAFVHLDDAPPGHDRRPPARVEASAGHAR